MNNPPTLTELKEFYYELSAAYGSPYSDNAADIEQTALKLRRAFTLDKQTPELLLEKIRQLRKKTNYQTKVSSLVDDRFWNKELTPPMKPKFYTPDEPVL